MLQAVPKLWTDTIEEHRAAVRDAALDAAARLIAEHGLRGVTMSRVAHSTRIGRATLYKYFDDVDALLLAWHERQVHEHLAELSALRASQRDPGAALRAVLKRYALLQHQQQPHAGGDAAVRLHGGEHVAPAHTHLHGMLTDLIAAAANAGEARADVPPVELATYCLHALGAATELTSQAALLRLVELTLTALQA